jgi:hypothetical protein
VVVVTRPLVWLWKDSKKKRRREIGGWSFIQVKKKKKKKFSTKTKAFRFDKMTETQRKCYSHASNNKNSSWNMG